MATCSTTRSSKPSNRAESSVSDSSRGELLHERLVERAAARRERDDPPLAPVAVDRVERGADDVHAKDHPGPAAVGLVVDLARAKRREVAVAPEAEVELLAEHARERPVLGEPGERRRDESEDVDLHQGGL